MFGFMEIRVASSKVSISAAYLSPVQAPSTSKSFEYTQPNVIKYWTVGIRSLGGTDPLLPHTSMVSCHEYVLTLCYCPSQYSPRLTKNLPIDDRAP